MTKNLRAFELDALRGLSIVMMLCHHFVFDVRYILGIDAFAFQDSQIFNYIAQPLFISIFLSVSGICCQFSKNNLRRAVRMGIAALTLSVMMGVFSVMFEEGLFVFFNILHLLTIGTLIYWLIDKLEARKARMESIEPKDIIIVQSRNNVYFLIVAMVLLLGLQVLPEISGNVDTYLLLPFGILPRDYLPMGDYLPMIPWLGVFLIGIVIGRTAYRDKKSIFPGVPPTFLKVTRPFEWVGRNSLVVYLVHQPVMLAILFSGRYFGWW
jgi:uncharacterized membrane protein